MQASTGTTVAIATPDLEITEGHVTTTSRQIAAHFNKRHDTVLRAIRNLECSDEYRHRNFAETVESRPNPSGGAPIESVAYRMTRDGFVFLAMGFTGKEAAQWKEAYINAFNKMEQELLARTTRPANPALHYERIGPADKQAIREAVAKRAGKSRAAYSAMYETLHRRFDVNSYHELPADALQEALALVESVSAAEWELVDEVPKPGHQKTVNEIVAEWVKKIEQPNGYPAMLFMPLVNAVLRKMGFTLPGSELPRLALTTTPPPSRSYKYDRANPYPRNGRTIEVAKSIVADIRNWSDNLPAGPAKRDLHDATDTLYDLLVSGWTEVDEALGQLSTAMHYLNRWQGRGGRMGNIA